MLQYSPQIQMLLRALYSEPDRTYHNLNHIKHMLSKVDEWSANTPETSTKYAVEELVQHAVWWHDSVFSIYSKPGKNESDSADLFGYMVRSGDINLKKIRGVSEDSAEQAIIYAILCTAKHLTDIDFNGFNIGHYEAETAKLLLDVDMVGFAEDFDMVALNSVNVTAEYTPMAKPREAMLKARAGFLTKLLERKRIFYTDYFYTKYEATARENIQRSIDVANEELATYTLPEPEEPWVYDAGNPVRRFINPKSGLMGFCVDLAPGIWQLEYDDGSRWTVTNIGHISFTPVDSPFKKK